MSPLKAIFGKKQRKRNFQEREVFSEERLSENYPTRLIPTIQKRFVEKNGSNSAAPGFPKAALALNTLRCGV